MTSGSNQRPHGGGRPHRAALTGGLTVIRADISDLRKGDERWPLFPALRALLGPSAGAAGGFTVGEGFLELGLADIVKQVYNVRSHDAKGAQGPEGSQGLQAPTRSEGPTRTD